jgi:hypothetical protein
MGAPALADTALFSDPRDAQTSADILTVLVDNSTTDTNKVTVSVRVGEFRDGDHLTVYFDTRRQDFGPEYRFGVVQGSEYGYTSMKTWEIWDRFLSGCSNLLELGGDGDEDVIRVAVPRACLGRPDKVRVSVHLQRGYSGEGTHDWAKAWRTWLPWVDR